MAQEEIHMNVSMERLCATWPDKGRHPRRDGFDRLYGEQRAAC